VDGEAEGTDLMYSLSRSLEEVNRSIRLGQPPFPPYLDTIKAAIRPLAEPITKLLPPKETSLLTGRVSILGMKCSHMLIGEYGTEERLFTESEVRVLLGKYGINT
jgi:hypothetical protein